MIRLHELRAFSVCQLLAHPLGRAFAWAAVAGSILFFVGRAAYETYGMDFYYYWSLAGYSRTVHGADVYKNDGGVLRHEITEVTARMKRDWMPEISSGWVRDVFPKTADPRAQSSPVPRRYFPEWSTIQEHTTNPHAKVSPASFGLIRLIGLDRVAYRKAFLVWNLTSIALLFLGVYWVGNAAGLDSIPLPWLLVGALWFDPIRSALIYGQVVELAFCGAAGFLAFFCGPRRRPFLAGILLAVSVLVKPLALGLPVFLAWGLIFRRHDRRFRMASAGLVSGAVIIMGLVEIQQGAGVWLGWLRALPSWYADYSFHLYSFANRSAFPAILKSLNAGPTDKTALFVFTMYQIGVLVPYAYFFLTRMGRSVLAHDELAPPAMAVLGPFLLSKFVLLHYGVFLLIPLGVLLARSLSPESPRAMKIAFCVFWFCFGFYESFDFLLVSPVNVVLTPVLLLLLPLKRVSGS